MIDLVADKLDEIRELCRKRGVTYLALFGSAACDDFDPDRSDVDFLVKFGREPEPRRFKTYLDLERDLRDPMGRPVDLAEYGAIRNPFFRRSVEGTKVDLYAEE